jgi:hypothetical protein
MTQYTALDEKGGRNRAPLSASDEDSKPSRPQLPSFSRALPTNLSEPLNASETGASNGTGGRSVDPGDPFYVFREDLYRKLELVDEALAEFLRVVHQTV